MTLQELDKHDHWPLRIATVGLVVIGISSVLAIVVLIREDAEIQGLFAIPAAVIAALSMTLTQRPPWSAQGRRGKPGDSPLDEPPREV